MRVCDGCGHEREVIQISIVQEKRNKRKHGYSYTDNVIYQRDYCGKCLKALMSRVTDVPRLEAIRQSGKE